MNPYLGVGLGQVFSGYVQGQQTAREQQEWTRESDFARQEREQQVKSWAQAEQDRKRAQDVQRIQYLQSVWSSPQFQANATAEQRQRLETSIRQGLTELGYPPEAMMPAGIAPEDVTGAMLGAAQYLQGIRQAGGTPGEARTAGRLFWGSQPPGIRQRGQPIYQWEAAPPAPTPRPPLTTQVGGLQPGARQVTPSPWAPGGIPAAVQPPPATAQQTLGATAAAARLGKPAPALPLAGLPAREQVSRVYTPTGEYAPPWEPTGEEWAMDPWQTEMARTNWGNLQARLRGNEIRTATAWQTLGGRARQLALDMQLRLGQIQKTPQQTEAYNRYVRGLNQLAAYADAKMGENLEPTDAEWAAAQQMFNVPPELTGGPAPGGGGGKPGGPLPVSGPGGAPPGGGGRGVGPLPGPGEMPPMDQPPSKTQADIDRENQQAFNQWLQKQNLGIAYQRLALAMQDASKSPTMTLGEALRAGKKFALELSQLHYSVNRTFSGALNHFNTLRTNGNIKQEFMPDGTVVWKPTTAGREGIITSNRRADVEAQGGALAPKPNSPYSRFSAQRGIDIRAWATTYPGKRGDFPAALRAAIKAKQASGFQPLSGINPDTWSTADILKEYDAVKGKAGKP